ncbi:MAG: hypothetical protein ABSH50_18885 [Bryobacteraceae bacterium]|jgi:hypothetical protein
MEIAQMALCFLVALGASAIYALWLGGYAVRHNWDEQYARSRAALVPYLIGAAGLVFYLLFRAKTGHLEWPRWAMLGLLFGGSLCSIMVRRRLRASGK